MIQRHLEIVVLPDLYSFVEETLRPEALPGVYSRFEIAAVPHERQSKSRYKSERRN